MSVGQYIAEVNDYFVDQLVNTLEGQQQDHQVTCCISLTGGFPLMLGVPPSSVEVYNDLDSAVLYFFECLRSKNRLETLGRLLPSSFKTYDMSAVMRGHRDSSMMDVDRIALWYVAGRSLLREHLRAVNAKKLFRSVGEYEVFKRNERTAFFYKDLADTDNIMPEVHGRLYRMQIEHYPMEKVVQIYDGLKAFFLVDLDHLSSVDDRKEKQVLEMLKDIQGSYLAFSLEKRTWHCS